MIETKTLDDPIDVASLYLCSSFIPDCIAVLPWAEINVQYIFLRYLKLIKFNIYQKYFDNFTIQVL